MGILQYRCQPNVLRLLLRGVFTTYSQWHHDQVARRCAPDAQSSFHKDWQIAQRDWTILRTSFCEPFDWWLWRFFRSYDGISKRFSSVSRTNCGDYKVACGPMAWRTNPRTITTKHILPQAKWHKAHKIKTTYWADALVLLLDKLVAFTEWEWEAEGSRLGRGLFRNLFTPKVSPAPPTEIRKD